VLLSLSACGAGVVDVCIIDPQGAKNTVRPLITKKNDDLWYVEYTAVISGLHSVNVFFAGKAVPLSPYAVGVATGMSMVSTASVNLS
jgi:filamin